MKNPAYLLALHTIKGLGPIRLKALIEYFQDPQLIWEAEKNDLLKFGIPLNVVILLKETRRRLNPLEYENSIKKSGISWVTLFDENYPPLLQEIYDPPPVLYYKGLLGKDRLIGVVGTRKMTGYGKTVTEKFTHELVQSGFTIVSGLARGIDTQAHKTTLEAEGRTIAVLGGGLNKIFPPENSGLALKIADGNGAVVSEFPPDYESLPGNFPARNRIISGLSKAILVTEAAEDSGSLITARLALEQGREVFAVPGPVTSDLSKGPAQLIQQGAKLVTCVQDILDELGMSYIQSQPWVGSTHENLSEAEKQILECLENEQKQVDEIVRELKKSPAEVSGVLIKMEIAGLVKNLGGGCYIKVG